MTRILLGIVVRVGLLGLAVYALLETLP